MVDDPISEDALMKITLFQLSGWAAATQTAINFLNFLNFSQLFCAPGNKFRLCTCDVYATIVQRVFIWN